LLPPASDSARWHDQPKEDTRVSRYFTSLVLFAVLYFPLRLLHDYWKKLSVPSWGVYIAGVLSWGVVVSLAGPPYTIGLACLEVAKHPNEGTAIEALIVIFLTGIILRTVTVHTEILDWGNMKSFLRESLFFRDYFAEHEDLFVQLEKKRIRDIHKETSGQELREPILQKRELRHTDPETAKRELEQLRAKPIQSIHFQEELGRLRGGETVDVTDTFMINVLKHPTHELYQHCYEMRINPEEKHLSFKVRLTSITAATTIDAERLYRIKQELYDLLQAIATEGWLKPYLEFFDRILVTSFRVQLDGFDLPQDFPFLSIDIPLRELRVREGKVYSVADIHTIATVTMHS
jgi:hypothetical protein